MVFSWALHGGSEAFQVISGTFQGISGSFQAVSGVTRRSLGHFRGFQGAPGQEVLEAFKKSL